MAFNGMTYEEVVALLHLEPGELRMMGMFVEYGDKWVEMRDLSEHGEDCVGMLVMEGLVERRRISSMSGGEWLNQWRITDAGAEFVTLEMSGETPRRNDA